MDRVIYRCGLSALVVTAFLTYSRAQEASRPAPTEDQTYELKLIFIGDAPTPEFLRVIAPNPGRIPGRAYRSLYAGRLRDQVKSLPKGSVIRWIRSDHLSDPEPSEKEIADFQAFFKHKKSGFTFIAKVVDDEAQPPLQHTIAPNYHQLALSSPRLPRG